jgi:hypothetical protein
MDTQSMIAGREDTFCPSCGMPCTHENLIMCLSCSSVYCGKGKCEVICPCQDEGDPASRPAQQLFARLVHENPSAVIIKDASGRVIHATDSNKILSRTLGWLAPEIVGKTNLDLFRPPQSTILNRVEFEVTSRQRPFRFVTSLTTTKGLGHRFMVEVAVYRMTPGDHLTLTTLTSASTSAVTMYRPWESSDLYALQT